MKTTSRQKTFNWQWDMLTERDTKAIVRDFLRYVKSQGGCDCKNHFLPLNP